MECSLCDHWVNGECNIWNSNAFGCGEWMPKSDSKSPVLIDVSKGEPLSSSTSKGNQSKWYMTEEKIFVKAPFNYNGVQFRDYLCEKIASSIGRQLNFPVIDAEVCKIKDGEHLGFGSFTHSFLAKDEVHITFYRLLSKFELTSFIQTFDSGIPTDKKFDMVLQVLKECCGIDASEYLFQMVVLDYLIGNEDRHLNNFGVVYSPSTKKYRMAPIFDSGLAFFEHDTKYLGRPLHVCMRQMRAKPFSADFDKSLKAARKITGMDVKGNISLSGLMFPSQKALGYLRIQAGKFGLVLDEGGVHVAERKSDIE